MTGKMPILLGGRWGFEPFEIELVVLAAGDEVDHLVSGLPDRIVTTRLSTAQTHNKGPSVHGLDFPVRAVV